MSLCKMTLTEQVEKKGSKQQNNRALRNVALDAFPGSATIGTAGVMAALPDVQCEVRLIAKPPTRSTHFLASLSLWWRVLDLGFLSTSIDVTR